MAELPSVAILLMTAGPHSRDLVYALRREGAAVTVASDLLDCLRHLQNSAFELLVLEDAVASTDSTELHAIQQLCGSTLILELNLAITREARAVDQVRLALLRRGRHEERAKAAAIRQLRDELSGEMSGLLLQSQLLLSQRGTPSREALSQLAAIATEVCQRLRLDDEQATSPMR